MPDPKISSQPAEWPQEWKDNPALQNLAAEHQSWLQHNTTQGLRQAIEKLERKLVDFMAEQSTDPNKPDNLFRLYSAQLKQINTLKKIIYDTPTFVKSL